MNHIHDAVTLERDCDAVLIPDGTAIKLRAGSAVFITQALGGAYTVNVNGNLARIDGGDADALGLTPEEENFDASDCLDASLEELVWKQLATCYDPEIPINIVDLGLVYECDITALDHDAGNKIEVKMTLTAPGCGMGDFLVQDVRGKLERLPTVSSVDVELVFDPPWSQEMMSEAARLQTGMYY